MAMPFSLLNLIFIGSIFLIRISSPDFATVLSSFLSPGRMAASGAGEQSVPLAAVSFALGQLACALWALRKC